MKIIRDQLVLLLIISIFYLAFKYLLLFVFHLAGVPYKWPIELLFSCCIVFFILGLTYNRIWKSSIFIKKSAAILFTGIALALVMLVWYASWLESESRKLYDMVVNEKVRGWKGNVHQSDDTLGLKPIPGATGFHTFPVGDDIPMKYNEYGFRVPVAEPAGIDYSKGVDLLFLGCSFTYGDACLAENTFPYLTATQLGYSYINAGVGSYGLSQMYILAGKLIPKYKPEYLVLQYSPWLVERALSGKAPTYFGSLYTPYFTKQNNYIRMEYPYASTQIFKIDRDKLRSVYKGKYIRFLIKVGIPFYVRESYCTMESVLVKSFNLKPLPAADEIEVVKLAYNEIIDLAEKNGTQVIILNLGDIKYTSYSIEIVNPRYHVKFAEADSMLDNYLKSSATKNYSREFNHWRIQNNDSVLVDGHPNPLAHQIIAGSIVSAIAK